MSKRRTDRSKYHFRSSILAIDTESDCNETVWRTFTQFVRKFSRIGQPQMVSVGLMVDPTKVNVTS